MNKRSIPIATVSCILALAGLLGYFLVPPAIEALPSRLLMENAGGKVVFTHGAHSTPGGAYGDLNCTACHHDVKVAAAAPKEGEQPAVMPCTACHGAAEQPDFVESHQKRYREQGGDAACATCHHTRIQGYASAWNHEEHWTYAGDDCATCHHADDFSAKKRPVKPQKCANCHTAMPNPLAKTTLKDAGHATCASCHEEWLTSGTSDCATCHGQVKTADAVANGTFDGKYESCSSCHKPLLGRMDAFHQQCRGCHDKTGKGPGTAPKADGLDPCKQCHIS